MNFIKSNLWELDRSPLLKHLGAILSFIHIINYVYWNRGTHSLGSGGKPLLCWEFLPNCTQLVTSESSLLKWLFTFYLVFSIISFLAFIFQRFVGLAWTMLLLVNGVSLFFYVMDASLSSDVLSLLFFINIGFLFVPNKAPLVRWSVIIFYLVTAYLELSPEWLSGISLHEKLPLTYKGLEWVAGLGIVLKATVPFLLLSPIGQRLAFGLIGLITFHLLHFYVFRDFTSVAMITLLSFYVFDYFISRQLEREALYQSYAHPEPSKLWWPIALMVYIFFQSPLVTGQSAATLFQIHGPQKTLDCRLVSFAKYQSKMEMMSNLLPDQLNPTLKCHPLVAFNSNREACNKLKNDPQFVALSSHFMTKGLADKEFKLIFAEKNICDPNVKFKKTVEY